MSDTGPSRPTGAAAVTTRLLSDERLVGRAAAGDERAFAAIFDRYHQRLYRYCVAIVGNSPDGQDALQSTMVKVLRALPGEERRIELKPWLYRIAHNESIELLRRRRETHQIEDEVAAPGPGLAAEVDSRQRLRQLIEDLDQLPERQRGAIVMRELAGLEFEEIGAALGTSAAVARQTLYEARLGLRQMDEGREMSCAAVTRALSEGDGRVSRRRDLRAHLRVCADCRRFGEEIKGRERDFAGLAPLPAAAAAGLLHGLLDGQGAGGLAGAVGAGAAKSLGASAALKGAATVAVVAAIGVGAADRGGLVDAGLPGGGSSQAPRVAQPPADPGGSEADPSPGPAPARAGATGVAAGAAADGETQVGDSRRADPAPASAPSPAGEADADQALSSPGSSAAAHPHGKGHAKQHPAAAAHGQQTAATHKAAAHGASGDKGHAAPAHPSPPSPPSPPSHPATPSPAKGPPAALPSAPSPEAQPPSHPVPEAGADTVPAGPPGQETGKKP